ncbi:MAG TPA: His/Gly/Thr/Pro-type tRNA ligase C-terminal domain-containing protein, partial [Nitrososphaeraceae archaeon]|nr:His/Gly/Thr/Pro-type tRNA ligase C-terminal domain-containing protein [Nitrososphaeraceae archaeon]
ESGAKKNPIILHNSPSGAVERVIYALLEKAAKIMHKGERPAFPLWLTHTQVRIIPIKKNHAKKSEEIEQIFAKNQIRADIDDREESVGKRIREAETEWIPFIIVIGDREVETSMVVVRDRTSSNQYESNLDLLINKIKKEIQDKPFMPLNLPKYLSKRPQILT